MQPAPYKPLTYLEANAEADPDRAAVIEAEVETSFAGLLARVRGLMSLLRGHRLQRGEVVAVSLPNVCSYVALEIAVPALGAVIMPLPPALGPHEIGSALERSGAVIAVTTSEGIAHGVARQATAVREVLTVPLADQRSPLDPPQATDTGPDDVVQIALTSGTTGSPKLAAFTAELKQVTFEGFTARLAIDAGDRVLPLSPITQGAGEMFLYSLRRGACLVMSGESRFAPERSLALAEQSRATVIGGVPTMLSRMLDSPAFADADLSSLRLSAVAGAPLHPELARAWEERTGAPIISFYGAMDIGQLAVPSPEDPADKRWHTVGRPHASAEWAILDQQGGELAAGSEGEICMRGPLVQGRYWDRESGPYADDGWAHFGDLGFIDDDGYLHVTGRVKDTIIRGGNNINPYELEEAIRDHPAVSEVAIVGRPDADVGERAVAFVVPSAEAAFELEQLTSFLDERGFAHYKWPEELHQLDELPLGPTGKLLRAELRDLASEDSATESEGHANPHQ